MGKIEVDVDDADLQRLEAALENGLEEGMEDSLDWLLDKGKEAAKSRIRSTDRVWRRQVYHGFAESNKFVNEHYSAHGRLINTAPHANIVDKGLAPAGMLENANPQVQDIIQWVSENMYPQVHAEINTESWDPELQALANQYSPGYVMTAFAVKRKLDKMGYPGIHFKKAAENKLRQTGPMVVKGKVEKHVRKEVKKKLRDI